LHKYGSLSLFDICHEKWNLAEYEGHFKTDEQLLSELIASAKELLRFVNELKLVARNIHPV
jgi:hypothetical protein